MLPLGILLLNIALAKPCFEWLLKKPHYVLNAVQLMSN